MFYSMKPSLTLPYPTLASAVRRTGAAALTSSRFTDLITAHWIQAVLRTRIRILIRLTYAITTGAGRQWAVRRAASAVLAYFANQI